ncbi:MAG: filamentous hemagglutinin N-terminal domain-containing protein [Microcoleaceae cyanobacterium]
MNLRIALGSLIFVVSCTFPPLSTAQILPDNTLGSESSIVLPEPTTRQLDRQRIEGGAIRSNNLFHSFEEFNIDQGGAAYFVNPAGIENILSRVTGNNPSLIFGTLGVLGNANLFFINPNGIVFGPEARLDVGGSFFASTADGIVFENGFEFAASNPDAPPLLTINLPVGLNIRDNPGRLEVEGIGGSRPLNPDTGIPVDPMRVRGLQVPQGETLTLLGGDILLEGGVLIAEQGQIELGSTGDNSFVGLELADKSSSSSQNYLLNYETVENFGDIQMENGALVVVRGSGGGTIGVEAQTLTLAENAEINASNVGNQPAAGKIEITTADSIQLDRGLIRADAGLESDPNMTATGVDVNLTTQNLLMRDGGLVRLDTFGRGDSGDITVQATDINIAGRVTDPERISGLFSRVQPSSTGNAGNIDLSSQRLILDDFATIISNSQGQGNSGNIRISSSESITVSNRARLQSVLLEGAIGEGGDIVVSAGRLMITDGSFVSASIQGEGNSGNILIEADVIELDNTAIDGPRGGILANVTSSGRGNGGRIIINASSLSIRGGARIVASLEGQGQGGEISINARDVDVQGTRRLAEDDDSTPPPSQIFAGVGGDGTAIGAGGTITINTDRLTVQDRANIETSVVGRGNGGTLNITAAERITLSNAGALRSTLNRNSEGSGGNVFLRTGRLVVADGASISASTLGQGNGGTVSITADSVELSDETAGRPRTAINAEVNRSGKGMVGDITISTQRLSVQGGGIISASMNGEGQGGNIQIDASRIEVQGVEIRNDDSNPRPSQISAGLGNPQAVGTGGSISISSDRLLIEDGATITASVFGQGTAGTLDIAASENIILRNGGGLRSTIGRDGSGTGGSIVVNTENLQVINGSLISTTTIGEGDAGSVIITADEIKTNNTITSGRRGGILAQINTDAKGDGGELVINTRRLSVQGGTIISASLSGEGQGGNIEINAQEIELIGTRIDDESSPSEINAGVAGSGIGNGGSILINADRLTVQDGANVTTSTFGQGNGGALEINAQ